MTQASDTPSSSSRRQASCSLRLDAQPPTSNANASSRIRRTSGKHTREPWRPETARGLFSSFAACGRATWVAGFAGSGLVRQSARESRPTRSDEGRPCVCTRPSGHSAGSCWASSIRRDSCCPKRRRCSTSSATDRGLADALGWRSAGRGQVGEYVLCGSSVGESCRDRRGDRRRRHRHDGRDLALQPALFPRRRGR